AGLKMLAVDQFHPSLKESSAVANEVLALQEIFQHSGHRSRIYAGESYTISGTSVESLRNYHARARDILLIHYSLSSPLLHEAFATSSRKALVYHKITPAHYLAGLDPALPEGSEAARAELAQYDAKVRVAVAHSGFSARDLAEAGYGRVEVIPYTLHEPLYGIQPDP